MQNFKLVNIFGFMMVCLALSTTQVSSADFDFWQQKVVTFDDKNFELFSQNFPNSNFHFHIWIQHEKCIQIITNKPVLAQWFFF